MVEGDTPVEQAKALAPVFGRFPESRAPERDALDSPQKV